MSSNIKFSIFSHPALGFFSAGTCMGLQFCLLWAFEGRGSSAPVFLVGIFGLASACIPIFMKAFSVRNLDLLLILISGLLLGFSLPLYVHPEPHNLDIFLLSLASLGVGGMGGLRVYQWHQATKLKVSKITK